MALVTFEIFSSNANLFTDEEIIMLQKYFDKNVSLLRKIPLFPGRGRIADLFYNIWKVLDCSSGWASNGKGLGNLY